jgi:hypothetical protein
VSALQPGGSVVVSFTKDGVNMTTTTLEIKAQKKDTANGMVKNTFSSAQARLLFRVASSDENDFNGYQVFAKECTLCGY